MVCGYDTGRLEIWHQRSMIYWKKVFMGWKLTYLSNIVWLFFNLFFLEMCDWRLCVCLSKVSDAGIYSFAVMPNDELAVGCSDHSVCVWKLERDAKKGIVGYWLFHVSVYLVFFCRNVPFWTKHMSFMWFYVLSKISRGESIEKIPVCNIDLYILVWPFACLFHNYIWCDLGLS